MRYLFLKFGGVLSKIVQKMFDKFLGKKRKEDVFIVPERKFAGELKNAAKLTPKGLLELVSDMQKYLNSLTEKMQQARTEYDHVLEKSDQFKEKNDVVNAQIAKMTNEHEQLTIKFDNLQLALESMSTSSEEMIKEEQAFLLQNSSTQQRLKSIPCFLKFYRSQTLLCKKVQTQNKLLKEKYISLEEQLHAAEENIAKLEAKGQTKVDDPGETAHTDTSEREVTILTTKFHEDTSQFELKIQESERREMEQQAQMSKANEQIRQLLSQREEMGQTLRQTASQVDSLRSIITSQQRNQQVEYLMGANATLPLKFQECRSSLHRSEIQRAKLEQLIKSLTEELTAVRTAEKSFKEEHTRIITGLRQECKALQRIRDINEAQLQKMNGEMKVAQADRKAIISKDEQIQRLNKNLSESGNELMALKAEKTEALHQLQNVSEECKGKVRKYECQLNQERIKNESMTRKINNLEAKTEENKISMDAMYEQGIIKDKKIAQMELKLKEYKRMIQLLRKEKEDIERDYESKLKGLTENAIIEHPDQVLTERSAVEEDQGKEAEITLKNQMLSMKEHDSILQQQNDKLRVQIAELECMVQEKESLIRGLQSKRDQIMKEIEKMGPGSQVYNQIHTHLLPRASEVKENHNREKKIAGKAVKGFEILAKLHQGLYKAFMAVFTKEVERDELKQIEAEINTLVKKSADMRDVFLDYM